MDAIDAALAAGVVSSYSVYLAWAKITAKKPRIKNPLARKKKQKRKQADETSLAAQMRYL